MDALQIHISRQISEKKESNRKNYRSTRREDLGGGDQAGPASRGHQGMEVDKEEPQPSANSRDKGADSDVKRQALH